MSINNYTGIRIPYDSVLIAISLTLLDLDVSLKLYWLDSYIDFLHTYSCNINFYFMICYMIKIKI